ncbi:MAG TPA: DUF4388 domain-containing protein [Myxococcaceae bacterium]|nr:DUF4388 domain-containing protein [Myxococcaceae bacterium]
MTDARFRFDGSGRLEPETPEAEAAREGFGERQGTYRLLPTTPDLLLLSRTPVQGARAPEKTTLLVGDASTFPLSDFIAFLAQSRFDGVLRIHAPDAVRAVVFKDGEVRGAVSDNGAERLGEVAVRLGYLDRATLEAKVTGVSPPKVGRIMVEQGLLQPHDLWKCLTQQVSDIFQAMVLCRDGVFELTRNETDELASQKLQLSTQSLLMDSIRKIDELAHFRKRIPHGHVYPLKKRGSEGKLEPDEDRVLALATGERTVFELGQAAKLSEFDVTKVLFRLLEGGYAQLSEGPAHSVKGGAPLDGASRLPPGGAAGAEDGVRRVVQVFNSIFRAVRDEVAQQSMEREFVAAANAALDGESLSASPVLKGLRFEPDGSLPEASLLREYERARGSLGSEPVASLKQALSDVMFFLLFHAGELLEPQADEALGKRVKHLLAAIEPE